MKVFIVFMGLLIINVSFLSYQGDLDHYVRCQAFLKAVAEESAAGAALYYDEEAYSAGTFQFDYEESRNYIGYFIEESKKETPLPPDSVITYEVSFQDDLLGYEDEDNPSVTVRITAEAGDLFRLPFLEVTEIKRAARYELPH